MEFEQRCKDLYAEDMEEGNGTGVAAVTAVDVTVEQLESMFPSLDAELVRALAADASTPQQAMETLLVLSASTAEPAAAPLPPRDIGIEDTDAFPSLVDADGWQVSSEQLFNRNPEADLGSVWRDRAKAIAGKPAPRQDAKATATVATQRKLACKQDDAGSLQTNPETEYELRHRRGEQRVNNRARFRRRRGNAVLTVGEEDGEEEDMFATNEAENPALQHADEAKGM